MATRKSTNDKKPTEASVSPGENKLGFSPNINSTYSLGRTVYITAWIVEIVAAIIGLFIAFSIGISEFVNIPEAERDFGAHTRAILGALPFVLIAILEPTKIYLASGLYHSRIANRLGMTLAFLVGLTALTFVTFETMFNALIQQNTNITQQTRQLVNERYEVLDAIETIDRDINRFSSATPQQIRQQFSAPIENLEADRKRRIDTAARDHDETLTTLTARLDSLQAQNVSNAGEVLREEISRLSTAIQDVTRLRQNAVSNINSRYKQQIDEIKAQIEGINEDRREQIDSTDDFFFGRSQIVREINTASNSQIDDLSASIAKLESQRDEELRVAISGYETRQRSLSTEQDRLRKIIASQSERLSQVRNTQIETVQRLIANSKADYAERLDAINAQIDKQIGEINVQKQASLETSGSQALLIPALQEKKSALVIKSNELRKTYREKVEKVQVYQLTAIVCGTLEEWCFKDSSLLPTGSESFTRARARGFDVADLPEEKVKFVSTLWFGSTALIVATMGTFLAFISFVLSEDRQIRTQRRSRSGKVIVMMFLRFSSLLKAFGQSLIEIAARTGDGFIYVTRALVYLIRFIIETLLDIIGMLADSLRILILVLSRGVHMTFVEIRRNIRQSASRTIDSVEASALVSPSLDKPTQADGIGKNNVVDNTASQESPKSQKLTKELPIEKPKIEENATTAPKVDVRLNTNVLKETFVPVIQKISDSTSASISSVRETLNKTLFNPDIIKSIGEKIPFKTDVAERVETPKKAPVSSKKPATKKQASVSTKELNAGRSKSPRPPKTSRKSPPKKWYED